MNKKLGYYTCNGQDFDSKIKCFIYATEVNQPVSWVFNDEVFNNALWDQEPTESLDALYDKRARELRERYDYIMLSYSGGSDSNNILMSFYRQGLRIDEIVTNWVQEASQNFTVLDTNIKSTWNHHAEYELLVRERLQWIKDHMPQTKITFFDCSRSILNYFKEAKDESWILNHRDPINPAVAQRFNYLKLDELHHRVDRQKSMTIIVGADKPKLFVDSDNQLFCFFTDRLANITPVVQHFTDYDNSTIEFFYWAPESVDILRKQAHTVLKYLSMNKHYIKIFRGNWFDRDAQEGVLKRVLYSSTWDDRYFQTNKSTKDWDNELDLWFTHQFTGTKVERNWRSGINYLEKNLRPDLLNPTYRGLRGFDSPFWRIGTIN